MPKSVNGGAGPISLKPTKRKPRQAPSAEELAREEAERVFQARVKYDRWVHEVLGWSFDHRNWGPLVCRTDESKEGLFKREEFARLPTGDLENYRADFDQAIGMLEELREQLDAALEARDSAGG